MTNLIPFKLKVSNEDLEDLNRRLNNTRLPDKPPIEAWKTGTDITWFKKLLNYWKNDYDWKKSEEELNTFEQFKININDKKILHYLLPYKYCIHYKLLLYYHLVYSHQDLIYI